MDIAGIELVFVYDPDLVAEVCDETRFFKQIDKTPLHHVRDFAGAGLFTAHQYEQEWGMAHRVPLPAFSQRAMKAYFGQMLEIAQNLAGKWERREGQSVNITDDYTRLTLDTIALSGFGYRFQSFDKEELHPLLNALLEALIESLRRSQELPMMTKLRKADDRKYRDNIRLMQNLVERVIKERREGKGTGEEDLLGLMLEATDPLPRAVVVDDEVRRILKSVGVHEEFATLARPAPGLRLLDARRRVIAEFPRSLHGHHGFPQTSMFDQPELERLLRDALARRPECELRGGVEVVSVSRATDRAAPVRVTFRRDGSDEDEHVWADAVLGCDGAGSITRDAIGAVWEDRHFEESWRVIDVRTSLPVRTWEGAEQICCPTRPATLMRIGEDRYRWEFRLAEGETLEGPNELDQLHELVAPWVDLPSAAHAGEGDDFEVIRQARYAFRARLADRWRRGRVFLLGDAAHLTPPFIGQGLCAGLRDARNLTWKSSASFSRARTTGCWTHTSRSASRTPAT